MLAFGTTQAQLLEKATPQERELLQRALGISDATQFMPGRVPDEVRRALGLSFLSSPDLRIVGSIMQGAPNDPFSLMQAYFVTPRPQNDVRQAIEYGLSQDGWQLKYPASERLQSRNAFAAPASAAPSNVAPGPYCKGDRNLNFFSLESAGTTNVSVSISRELPVTDPAGFSSGCPARTTFGADNAYSPAPPPSGQPDLWANWPLPRLAAPSGARVQETGSSAGSDMAKDIASVFAEGRTASQVFDHYVEQLRGAGWRLTGRKVQPSGEFIAGFNFRFQNRELQGRLSMTPKKNQPGRFDVQLESFGR